MKKIFVLFVVMVLLITVPSCQKEEILISDVQIEAIKAQLVATPTLSKEEVETVLSSQKLKSASLNEEETLVQVLDLDERTFEVNDQFAIKNLVYMEFGQNGNLLKLITIRQIFDVNNGNIDVNSYSIEYEIGCSYSRNFQLGVQGNVNQITFFLHFKNGKQLAFYGNGNNNITLLPIARASWQLLVNYYDNILQQQYLTDLINFYDQSNVINLRLELKSKNLKSTVKFDRNLIEGAYNVQLGGFDASGNYRYMSYQVMYDSSMPEKISFEAYFDIQDVNICGTNGCYGYSTKDSKYTVYNADGTILYSL